VPGHGGGTGLFEADPAQDGVSCSAVTTMDGTRQMATVRLDGATGLRIGGQAREALAGARDLACIALSAEQVGAARRALDMTVDYTKVRVQFGRAVGGFQALQHRMADCMSWSSRPGRCRTRQLRQPASVPRIPGCARPRPRCTARRRCSG